MKLYAEAYGCAMNKGETGEIIRAWVAGGHELASRPEDADALLLATCVVIESTERKVLKRLAALGAVGTPMAVTGCIGGARTGPAVRAAPAAKFFKPADVAGPKSWLLEISNHVKPHPVKDTRPVKKPRMAKAAHVPFTRSGDAICSIPIASGCAGTCAYCITRLARGGISSRPIGDVLDEARAAISAGAAEIRLCAQDSGAYGADCGSSLPELVNAVSRLQGDFMVRVGMMNPATAKTVFGAMLESYEAPKVFKFLHLPVQSGDDRILAAMERKHTAKEALDMIAAFRSRFPESTISTDVIAGFPGEDSAAHEETMNFLRAARPDTINVTRFSPRPGTVAAAMKGIPHGRETKARSRELTALRMRMTARNNRQYAGRQMRVLATELGRGGTTLARTRGYGQVVIRGVLRLGKWYDVTIYKSTSINLFGELAE